MISPTSSPAIIIYILGLDDFIIISLLRQTWKLSETVTLLRGVARFYLDRLASLLDVLRFMVGGEHEEQVGGTNITDRTLSQYSID